MECLQLLSQIVRMVAGADGPDEEEILLPEFRVWAPLGGAHCTTVLTVLQYKPLIK